MDNWRFERLDSLALQGMARGDIARMALHLHGSWGNFYENAIAVDTYSAYLDNGYGYATVNLNGHDAGTVTEDLASYSEDISAWLRHFEGFGTREWVLQGHSLGALKAIQGLATRTIQADVRAVVLMSPFDLPSFYAGSGDEVKIRSKRAEAQALARSAGQASATPPELFDIWPISLGTLVSALELDGALDCFQSRAGSYTALQQLDVPVLVLLGGEDFAATPNNREVAGQLSEIGVRVELIEGAPHNFAGHEKQVSSAVDAFLKAAT